ncbi:MAG: AMP-binding protein [Spirochaetales bacterium]|nr:AMP-binding protein [Spirochaetales bacterium]
MGSEKTADIKTTQLDGSPLRPFPYIDVDTAGEKSIYGAFSEQAAKTPNNIAINDNGKILTYAQLDRKAALLAAWLHQKGVRAGDRVGILLKSSLNMTISILGVLRAGGTFVFLNPENPKKRLLFMIEQSRISIILTDSRILKHYSAKGFCHDDKILMKNICITDKRPPIVDLDSLPTLDRSYIDYNIYSKHKGWAVVKSHVSLVGSRGCVYNCIFCHKIWLKYVYRSAERVFDEFKMFYDMGIRRFVFLDNIFNCNKKNSTRLLELIVKSGLKAGLFFPAGLRGDILNEEYIDLLAQAGAVNFPLALETASPRLQKLTKKNLKLDKFKKNLQYICKKHPHICIELHTMHGFPGETKEEAKMTMDFIKSIKWLHFPYIHILRIYPNTEMEQFALDSGISQENINRSMNLAYHELPSTLPFSKQFTMQYRSDFFNNYFMLKERLKQVLPYQMKIYTEDELLYKYNIYLPVRVDTIDELLRFFGIGRDELPDLSPVDNDSITVNGLQAKMSLRFPGTKDVPEKRGDTMKILMLDLSFAFNEGRNIFTSTVVEPMGLMSVLTYLDREYGSRIIGKIAVSMVDFNSFDELREIILNFMPDVIGIRTFSFYKSFFHEIVSKIKNWGIEVPIVTGGPYATCDYKTLLLDRNVDIAFIGEGEESFCELIGKMLEKGRLPEKGYQLPPDEVLAGIRGIAFLPGKIRFGSDFTGEMLVLDRDLEKISVGEEAETAEDNNEFACMEFISHAPGKPGSILIKQKSLLNLCAWHNVNCEIDASDRIAVYPGGGDTVWHIFPYLLKGASIYFINESIQYDVNRLNHFLEKNNITVCHLPTHIAGEFILLDNTSLKILLTEYGKLAHAFTQKYKLVFYYGYEEGSFVSACGSVMNKNGSGDIPVLQAPVFNTWIYILDENLRQIRPDTIGEIFIAGEGIAKTCLGSDPGEKDNRFVDNPFIPGQKMFRTGDRVRKHPDGSIEIIGRNDNLLRLKGYRMELGEIEKKLNSCSGVNKAAVIAVREDNSDESYLSAFLEGSGDINVSSIKENLMGVLPSYMVPEEYTFINALPLTPEGDVDRDALSNITNGYPDGWILE